jgi:predicted nicotinamide N-methyase
MADATATEAADAEAARVLEMAALFKIHGVDQRSSELLYVHPALGGDETPIRLRQEGSNSSKFVPGTSTVIWPCAYSLGDFLCDATVANRESDDPLREDPTHAASLGAITPLTVVVEVGAGLGLAGLVAARLGAKRVSITDATTVAARRNLETSGLTNATVDELWWRRAGWRRARARARGAKKHARAGDALVTERVDWSPAASRSDDDSASESESDEEPTNAPNADETVSSLKESLLACLPREGDGYPHLIIASDVCYSQGRLEMQMLADTVGALCGDETRVLIVFEDRGDCCWGTLQHFWRAAETAGLEGESTPVDAILIGGAKRKGEGRHNDSERLLLRLRRTRRAPKE